MVIGLIGIFVLLILIDIRLLLVAKMKRKTMAVYFLLIAVGFTLSILLVKDVPIASPTEIIETIVDSILMR